MQDFRNLKVWQLAHRLTLGVYVVTKQFPNEERFGLTNQIRRATVSIESNLAEGCGRGGDSDFRRFVQMAMGSASELECQLMLAHDLKFVEKKDYSQLNIEVVEVKRMLASLLIRLKAES